MDIYIYIVIFLAADFLLLVYVLRRLSRKKFRQKDLQFFKNEWQKIRAQQDGKHALLDADKLLHAVLEKKGFQGSVGDQLKSSAKLFTRIDDVWYAHKLRNQIAHELDMRLSLGDHQRALRIFEQAFKDLKAL